MEQPITFDEIYQCWPSRQVGLQQAFKCLTTRARKQSGCDWALLARPGVSYSFRGSLAESCPCRTRPVYLLIDIVISEVDPWFLSVCFYEDEITDPRELGNPIPEGLFQETGYCFDVDDNDPEMIDY